MPNWAYSHNKTNNEGQGIRERMRTAPPHEHRLLTTLIPILQALLPNENRLHPVQRPHLARHGGYL